MCSLSIATIPPGFGLTSARKIGERGFIEVRTRRNGMPNIIAIGFAGWIVASLELAISSGSRM